MTTIRGARERARTEVMAAIKDEARGQLAAEGASKLSLRAVARELGMVSSALYRYFPSRDDLLTALIVDAYDAVGSAAEQALTAGERAGAAMSADSAAEPGVQSEPVDHVGRWAAVCAAVRAWALAHPHEYALIYGSPVPGYSAPQLTVAPASRVALALISVAQDAHRVGGITLPALSDELRPEAERLTAQFGLGLPPEVTAALVASWAQLFGLISFEVFGQFNNLVEARDELFAQATRRLAHDVGMRDAG
ncbi:MULTISPECIES: WHG domain-containing protein [unclassified Streptomyces]|uniref:TetR/AcrR family transcriptional regulator n=1 Tax=unclassified Streptomyces TaxID=2593676 RepID=UPI00081E3303|nr:MULTISPECIES: WHG domain-containing protein [unclassified Streptomyces]MYZ39143.1 TetR family transcriptional regulator [Streptomyces sp. SID4917]SCG02358.1 transcriptional regulator, TetR family [Streptomyces sp. MnatMP-M17]